MNTDHAHKAVMGHNLSTAHHQGISPYRSIAQLLVLSVRLLYPPTIGTIPNGVNASKFYSQGLYEAINRRLMIYLTLATNIVDEMDGNENIYVQRWGQRFMSTHWD